MKCNVMVEEIQIIRDNLGGLETVSSIVTWGRGIKLKCRLIFFSFSKVHQWFGVFLKTKFQFYSKLRPQMPLCVSGVTGVT